MDAYRSRKGFIEKKNAKYQLGHLTYISVYMCLAKWQTNNRILRVFHGDFYESTMDDRVIRTTFALPDKCVESVCVVYLSISKSGFAY